jgi:hypothetical protein
VLTTSAGAEAVEAVAIHAEGAVGLTDITLPAVAELLVEDVSPVVLEDEEDPELMEDEVEVVEEPLIAVTALSPVPLVEELPLPAAVAVPDSLADGVAAPSDEPPLPAVVVAPDPLEEGDVSLPEELSLPVVAVVLDEEPPITVMEEELSDCPRAAALPRNPTPRASSTAMVDRDRARVRAVTPALMITPLTDATHERRHTNPVRGFTPR